MAQIIQVRRDTTANWDSVNPILADGEVGYELTDGDTEYTKCKVGNGVDHWVDLHYFGGGTGGTVTVENVLTSTSTTNALSAAQGKVLQDNKVDNSRVLTDVPSGAVFTDTTYTDAEIKTAYENNADTNAFSDSEKTKLANLTDNFKGYYADSTARDNAVPTPTAGWYVLQDDTDSIWFYDGTTWVNTGSTSTGDMLKAIYDPTNIAADTFTRANHTGEQAISTITGLQATLDNKADKTNVLELDNTTEYSPTTDYHPSTKKYVDDSITSAGGYNGWTVSDGTNSENIANADSVIVQGTGATTSNYNTTTNTLTINSTDTTYTDAEIKTKYENNADTNAFTDAEKTKLASALTSETVTSLSLATNILTYTDENGTATNLDLSLYLDDTNLARITSGTLNGETGIATFTRDDATTFTVDMSALLSDVDSLQGLTDTNLVTITDGQILKYDNATSKWINHTLAESDIPTLPQSKITNLETDLSNKANITGGNAFTGVQTTSITAGSNAIDFSVGNNFTITATAANITASNQVAGQSGVIIISSSENITGWSTAFKFPTVPTGLTGKVTFAYFVEDVNNIIIAQVK